MITCRYCDGHGKIRSAHSEAEYDCADCDGTGEVDPRECPDCGGEREVKAGAGDPFDSAGMTPCPTCT